MGYRWAIHSSVFTFSVRYIKKVEEKTCNPAVCSLIDFLNFIYLFFLVYITHICKFNKKTM